MVRATAGCSEDVLGADVSSAVESEHPAARKDGWKLSAIGKQFSAIGVGECLLRRAGRPGSTAGRMPAATEKRRECANDK